MFNHLLYHKNVYCLFVLLCNVLVAFDVEQPPIGNLALPSSQQVGPIFCFGQNIVNSGDLQAITDINAVKINGKVYTEVIPSMLYGVSDSFALYFGAPIATPSMFHMPCATGLQSIFVQGEYALYTKKLPTYTNQITFVGNMVASFNRLTMNLPFNYDISSFFIGATASHLATEWYAFISPGMIVAITRHEPKCCSTLLYQAGFGRNIAYSPSRWLLTLIVECFGQYTPATTCHNKKISNTGGNVIFLGPTLWFATKQFATELGISYPVVQHLNGHQPKDHWFAAFDCRYTF